MTDAFYMVCRRPTHPNAKTEPKARYGSEIDALEAAQQLADQTDADFVVLRTAAVVSPRSRGGSLFDAAH